MWLCVLSSSTLQNLIKIISINTFSSMSGRVFLGHASCCRLRVATALVAPSPANLINSTVPCHQGRCCESEAKVCAFRSLQWKAEPGQAQKKVPSPTKLARKSLRKRCLRVLPQLRTRPDVWRPFVRDPEVEVTRC